MNKIMTKTTFAITFLAITLLMTPATFQSAYTTELVTNGSFEEPDVGDGMMSLEYNRNV